MNNSNVDYYLKYLKYKNKYLSLKKGGSLLEDPDFRNLTVQENLLLNQEIISENSYEGIIYKVTYNGNNYVYKKSVLSEISGYSIKKFNILGDDYLRELILELKILNKMSDENDSIIKIFKIVVDENNKFTGWLMEDLSHMITLSKFCAQDNLVLDESKEFITEQLSDAIITFNRNGFSLRKIEHSDNFLINPVTMKIKLIDVDGILNHTFKSVDHEKKEIRYLIDSNEFLICYENLVDLTIEKYANKYNNFNYSPYYELAMEQYTKNKSLIDAYNVKQGIIERKNTEEYIEKLRKSISPDKINNLNYLSTHLFGIFYINNRNKFNLLKLINSDFSSLKTMTIADLKVYFEKNFNIGPLWAYRFFKNKNLLVD